MQKQVPTATPRTSLQARRTPGSALDARAIQLYRKAKKLPKATTKAPRALEIIALRDSKRQRSIPNPTAGDVWDYAIDYWQRQLLFLDTLRERANNMLEHERAGLPPLLDFKYETLLDARQFARPANYALLRITEAGEDCWVDCVDPNKPPVIVIDPRAGHGPGIGGFKRQSEVGMALREGHPVYFVVFFPEPMRGQTLEDVHHALRRFVEEVARRHVGRPPVLYGNCQAGWAVTLLSADCEGLVGPAVLNGSPLSYWAGEPGVNPMRLAGGMLGGVWLAHFVADLGGSRFDGAWLAANFENLKPERAIWEKYAGLFHDIDAERNRFLEFERWWGGFYFLSREEILAIVENLFIGNQLEEGHFRICEGCYADLKRVRNPLVIFASYGDDITPPHQALGWISVVYGDTDTLKKAGQRIVYLINPHVGHLGIFVSASVVGFEHRAILESLDEIATLEPGFYEMKIANLSGDPDCHKPRYSVRFEERKVEELRFKRQSEALNRVRAVSEFNELLYRMFVSSWIQAAANPYTADLLRWLHPMRTSRYWFADAFNPWILVVATFARAVARIRKPLPQDHPLLEKEREIAQQISDLIGSARKLRDANYEQVFKLLYG